MAELLFLEKVDDHFKAKTVWQDGTSPVLN
jgi:hypothetical protein